MRLVHLLTWVGVALTVGCAPSSQRLVSRPSPPEDVFSCYLRTLAHMGYRAETADRDAGLIVAVKENTGLLAGEYAREATLSVIPVDDGSEVSITMRATRVANDGGRSTAGMTMNSETKVDLRELENACQK